MFEFEDLTADTRTRMLQELARDVEQKQIFYDARLVESSRTLYLRLLADALEQGSPESFSEAILKNSLLNPTEMREIGEGRRVQAKVSKIAHRNIGEAEFNRYYMRAICLKAIEQSIEELAVYRARASANPRPDAADRKNAKDLLEHLRTTNISVLGSFPGPNSGRSVRIPSS
jgi:DNA repair protein RadC